MPGNEEEVGKDSHDVAPLVVVDAGEWTEGFVTHGVRSVFASPVDGDPHWQAVKDYPNRDYREIGRAHV